MRRVKRSSPSARARAARAAALACLLLAAVTPGIAQPPAAERPQLLRCAAVFAVAAREATEPRVRDGYGQGALMMTTWASEADPAPTKEAVERVGRDLVQEMQRIGSDAPGGRDPARFARELEGCRVLFNHRAGTGSPARPGLR